MGLLDSAVALVATGPGIHVASAQVGNDASGLIGRLDVYDTDLPLLRGSTAALQVVLSGGAGQIAGPAGLTQRLGLTLSGLRLALRDYDDLAGNVRRVVAGVEAARSAGDLAEETVVVVDLPVAESPYGWTAALDEAAAADLQVAFRLGGTLPDEVPAPEVVAQWIDAALDRETPFTISRGVDRWVRTDSGHGLLNVLLATQAAWDGADAATVATVLGEPDASVLVADLARATSARRWFRSASTAAVDDLLAPDVLGELFT